MSKPAATYYPEGLHHRAILGTGGLCLDSPEEKKKKKKPDIKAYMQLTDLGNDPRMHEM